MALLAGQPAALDTGQPFWRRSCADLAIDWPLEYPRGAERFDDTATIGGTLLAALPCSFTKSDDVSRPNAAALRRAGQQALHQAQAVALYPPIAAAALLRALGS